MVVKKLIGKICRNVILIMTSVLRAATDRRPSKISRLKIETAVSRSNLFLKITKLISIPYNKKWVFFSTFLTSTHSFLYQKSDFYLIKFGLPIITSSIYREYFEKSKKRGITREKTKFKKTKKYCFDLFSIRVVMQIIKYLVQLARELGQGQTDRHTDIHRTDQRLKTYTFFSFFISISSSAV